MHGSRPIKLEAALLAVEDPELGLPLGDLGLLRRCGPAGAGCSIEVALPVAAWPGTDELAEAIHRAARSVGAVEEVELDFVVMNDEERTALRHRLRAGMLGDGARRTGRARTGTATAGHEHAAAPMPAFLSAHPRRACSASRRARVAWASRR